MANTPEIAVPDFATACARAREMEKNLLSAKPSPISGSLLPEEGEELFPQEYESHTYAFLLSEAQKIERKLYMKGLQKTMQSSRQGASGAPSIDEAKMEADLHKFASVGELPQAPTLPQEKAQPPAPPVAKAPLPKLPSFPFGKKKEGKNEGQSVQPAKEAPAAMPQQGFSVTQEFRAKPPPVPQVGKETEEKQNDIVPQEAQEFEREHPGYEPPEEEESDDEKLVGPPLQETKGDEEDFIVPGKEKAPVEEGKEKFAALSEEPLSALREIPEPGQQPPAARSPSSASKLSPRLRAIIEEKLRREEERKKKEAQEAAGFEKPIEVQAEEVAPAAKQEGEMALSARERLIRKLQKEPGAAKPLKQREMPLGQEAPEPTSAGQEAGEEKGAEQEEMPGQQYPKEKEEEKREPKSLPRQSKRKSASEPQEAQEEVPAVLPKEEFPSAKANQAPASGITIQPIFPGEEAARQPQQQAKPVEESERLRRIQRIIEELSPDKYRASAISAQPAKGEPQEPRQGQPAEEGLQEEHADAKQPARGGPRKARREERAKAEGQGVKTPSRTLPVKQTPKQPSAKKGRAQASEKVPVSTKKIPEAKKALLQEQEKQQKKKSPALQEEEAPIQKKMKLQQTAKLPANKGRVLPQKPAPVQLAPLKVGKRILPGGQLAQTPAQETGAQTYVPPARQQLISKMQQKEEEAQQEESLAAQEGESQELPEEEPSGPKASDRLPPAYKQAIPKKTAYDEPVEKEATPEEIAEERRMRSQAAALEEKLRQAQALNEGQDAAQTRQPAPPQASLQPTSTSSPSAAKKTRDIAGEASLPEGKEGEMIDEAEIPKPPSEEPPASPVDYAMAKGEFKRKLEDVEVKEKALAQTDEFVEQYAKENLVWLYEIYKMGGMTREDFLQKSREKLQEAASSQQQEQEPPASNPALSNLEKELERKKK